MQKMFPFDDVIMGMIQILFCRCCAVVYVISMALLTGVSSADTLVIRQFYTEPFIAYIGPYHNCGIFFANTMGIQ